MLADILIYFSVGVCLEGCIMKVILRQCMSIYPMSLIVISTLKSDFAFP